MTGVFFLNPPIFPDVQLAAHGVHHAARSEEQEALEKGMGHEMEDARRISPHAYGHEHETELADGGIGENFLDVVLGKADGGGKKRGQHAHQGDDEHRIGRHAEEIIKPGDHVDAGGNHRGRMDQRTDRRGAFHGVGQPHVKGDLGRLAHGAHKKQQRNDGHDGSVQQMGVAFNFGKFQGPYPLGAQTDEEQKDAGQEAEISDPVDNKSFFPGIGGRIFFVPEADQQIGAESHAFPAHEHQQEVVARNQQEHHKDEEIQVDEKSLEARIVVHVADGVHMDEKADARYDEAHDDGKGVDSETDGHLEFARTDPGVDVSLKDPGRRRQLQKLVKNGDCRQKGEKEGEAGDPGNKCLGNPASEGAVNNKSEGREKGYEPDIVSHKYLNLSKD